MAGGRRYGYMERIQQGKGFMNVLLDHVIALLYKAMAHKVDASEALRKAFKLPPDPLAHPNPEDSQLTLAPNPLQVPTWHSPGFSNLASSGPLEHPEGLAGGDCS
jgi:hypothetical protein